MAPIIRTDDLTKDYGHIRGLDGLTLEVQDGEVMGFLGPNGSGKTTTIRLLLDLLRPTRGSAAIGGFDCHRQSLQARRLVGYLPGEMPVYPELSGGTYLAYLGSLGAEPPPPDAVQHLLHRFGIGPAELKRRLRDLSHGMKRKLGIVSALMTRPTVAILDEPTSGLDPLMIEAFAETLAELKRDGRTTVFLSSHVLSEVERTCDRVAVIRDGRLAAVRTIAAIQEALPRRVTVHFTHAESRSAPDLPGVRVVSRDGARWDLEVAGPLGPLLERLQGLAVSDIDVQRSSLEDYVLGLYTDR
ncbi:MAG TPA: ABC transporter ATP-binding protein [Vicinamibacterales bacterium]